MLGDNAMIRLAQSEVLVCCLGGLGVEIGESYAFPKRVGLRNDIKLHAQKCRRNPFCIFIELDFKAMLSLLCSLRFLQAIRDNWIPCTHVESTFGLRLLFCIRLSLKCTSVQTWYHYEYYFCVICNQSNHVT